MTWKRVRNEWHLILVFIRQRQSAQIKCHAFAGQRHFRTEIRFFAASSSCSPASPSRGMPEAISTEIAPRRDSRDYQSGAVRLGHRHDVVFADGVTNLGIDLDHAHTVTP